MADGRVFVLDYRETEPRTMDGIERILALDEESGEVLWTREWATTYRMLMFSYASGPRATPTVDGDRVFLTGASGRISCLDARTGEVIWDKDTMAEYDAYVPVWGTSVAPLVDGDRVIFVVGGEPDALVMAFDKHTGEELWRALEPRTEMGYSQSEHDRGRWCSAVDRLAPVGTLLARSGDRRVVLGRAVPGRTGPIADPVRSGPYLLVSGFYTGSMMMRLSPGRPQRCSGRTRAATASWRTASRLPRRTACTRTSRRR